MEQQILEKIKAIKQNPRYQKLSTKSRGPSEQRELNKMKCQIEIYMNQLKNLSQPSPPPQPIQNISEVSSVPKVLPRRRKNNHKVISADVIVPPSPKTPRNPLLDKITNRIDGPPNNHIVISADNASHGALFEPDSDSLDDFINNTY